MEGKDDVLVARNNDSAGRSLYNERRSEIQNYLGRVLDTLVELNADFCDLFGKNGRLLELYNTTFQDIRQHHSDALGSPDNNVLLRRFNHLCLTRNSLLKRAKPFGEKVHALYKIARTAINGLPAAGDKMTNFQLAKSLAKLETDDRIYKCYREINIKKLKTELATLSKEVEECAKVLEMVWINTNMKDAEE